MSRAKPPAGDGRGPRAGRHWISETTIGGHIDHFIGQSAVVAQVKTALEAAYNDGTTFINSMLTGDAGVGKTQIARIIGAEMGCETREVLGQNLKKPSDLNRLLLEASERSVLHVDEGDEVTAPIQTALYRAIEDRVIFVNSSASKTPRMIPLAPFTTLLSTNNAFRIVKPLRERFRLILQFQYYSADEIQRILKQRLLGLRWDCEEAVIGEIASRSRGTPRMALRLLESCRRTCRAENALLITMDHFRRTCELEGIDALGLDRYERSLLGILREAGKPLRLRAIAMRLGLPSKTVSSVIESYLVREGLIVSSDFGRELTAKGLAHLESTGHREDEDGT